MSVHGIIDEGATVRTGLRSSPTPEQLRRRDRLAALNRRALRTTLELAGAVAVVQKAALIAVDITHGGADDSDLLESLREALPLLDDYVHVEPMRECLREMIDELRDEIALTDLPPGLGGRFSPERPTPVRSCLSLGDIGVERGRHPREETA